jgi:hypothetical protein
LSYIRALLVQSLPAISGFFLGVSDAQTIRHVFESQIVLTTDQRQALTLLSSAANGCTVPIMLAFGCTITLLRHLVRRRLAVTKRLYLSGKTRSSVIRLRITEAGQRALADGNAAQNAEPGTSGQGLPIAFTRPGLSPAFTAHRRA